MEQTPFHVLWVSSTQFVPAAVQQMASRQTAAPVRLTQSEPYDAAIQAAQCASPDAILVMDDFDSLAVLEFVHHARLLNSQIPIIIVCAAYDAALDYKSHRLGATDCITLAEFDAHYLSELTQKRQRSPARAGQQPLKRKSVLQIPALFK